MPTGDPVFPGQRLRIGAKEWNEVRQGVREYRANRPQGGGLPPAPGLRRDTEIIIVRNDTGEDLGIGEVVGLTGILIGPGENLAEFLRHPVFAGETYDQVTHGSRWGITTQPIADGAIGPLAIDGAVPARIDSSDASHQYASPVTGSARLQSGNAGPIRLLWLGENSTDNTWCLASLPEVQEQAAQLIMGSGNTIGTYGATTYKGLIGSVSVAIDEVPTAAPSAIDTAYSNGLSAAWLGSELVWVSTRLHLDTNDDATPDAYFTDAVITIPEDVAFLSYVSHQVPVNGGGFATVYLPGII